MNLYKKVFVHVLYWATFIVIPFATIIVFIPRAIFDYYEFTKEVMSDQWDYYKKFITHYKDVK